MSDNNIINLCLKHVLNNESNGEFKFDDLVSTRVDANEFRDKLKLFSNLFSVENKSIKVNIKVGVCRKIKTCNNDCNLLHICEHELKHNGCRRPCRFEHSLETPHNMNVLNISSDECIDTKLLKKVFQKYYISEYSKETSNEQDAVRSESKSSSVIEVDLPPEFCTERDKEVFYLIFSSKRIGGSTIIEEESRYDAKSLKAFIFYENPDIAERLANKKVIEYQNFQFNVKLAESHQPRKVLTTISSNIFEATTTPSNDSNQIKVTDVTNKGSLTLEKIRSRFIFTKDNILGIDIQPDANTAIVKFSSTEIAESMGHLLFQDIKVELVRNNSIPKQKVPNKPKFFQKPDDLVKSLRNNIFLSMIMDSKDWRSKLLENLSSNYAQAQYDKDNLTIKCTLSSDVKNYEYLARNWQKKINSVITSFLGEFSIDESIKLDEYDIVSIKNAISKFNRQRGFSVSYKVDRKKIYIVTKRNLMIQFLNSINDCAIKNSKNMGYILPDMDKENYELIRLLLKKLEKKYSDMEMMVFEEQTQKIQLRGPGSRVDQVYNVIFESISKIRCEKLTVVNDDCLKCGNLNNILEMIVNERRLFCKLKKTGNGVFAVYIDGGVDSPTVKDINELNDYLSMYFTHKKISLKDYANVLNSVKWVEFKIVNLMNSQEVIFEFVDSMLFKDLIIFGKKELVFALEYKIQHFLNENNASTKTIDLPQNDILYFKYANNRAIHELESLDKNIKIEFLSKSCVNESDLDDMKEYDLVVNNCNDSLFKHILDALKVGGQRKIIKNVEISGLPGLSKVLHKNNVSFKNDLEKLRVEKQCSISFKTVLYDYQLEIKESKAIKEKPLTTDNRKQIGKSYVNIQKGNIANINADVIVNSCTASLNLSTGAISKCILVAAGSGIQYECLASHPNGITSNDIVITSPGKLKNCKKLYHVTCSSYVKNNPPMSYQILEGSILNCLKQLKRDKLKSIAIPAIGTGNLKFPPDIAAYAIIDTCCKYLEENKDEQFEVNIIIYEDNVYEIFKNKIKTPESQWSTVVNGGNDVKKIQGVKRARANFKIISNSDASLKDASSKLINLINNYIIRDKFENETAKNLKLEKLNEILKVTEDIEVTRNEDGVIYLNGYKDDVMLCKEQINNLMISHFEVASKAYQKYVKVPTKAIKDIQWEYDKQNEWMPFNLFINTIIEDAYSNKEKMATFLNEDGVEATVYFDNESYVVEDEYYSIKRTHTPKLHLTFPENWVFSNSESDYKVVQIERASNEFDIVMNEFLAKLQRTATVVQIERIQNKRLYQGYLLHKDYIKKKNNNFENEKILYHGTDEKNVLNICRTGFNRSYCGINGVAYGQGVYFALYASYSHNYIRNYGACRKMFRCRVLVGSCTPGSSGMKVAPVKPDGESYDSTGDPAGTVFVCYHDDQCYPEYLIHYM